MIKERLSGEDDDNHMLGRPSPHHPTQLSRLLDWLEQQQKSLGNAPKFVVSSSVFAPNPISARVNCSRRAREASDSWPGFPKTKRAILNHIVTKKIQNVIFISGDIHCSNVAELTFSGTESAENLKAFSVTSSAFYWPFPFADGDPADYVHNSAEEDDTFIVNDKVSMDYTASHFTQQDNFCRVDVDKGTNRLVFTAYDKHGKTISEEVPHGGMQRIAARLQLAPW